eukprot:TRINITY_DN1276_c1_g1_i3.p4 TRINITY_DN1276_c1_g1~~TRINITY_DN1276_c1_g1_i3.p4  ORF type:complete len:227 (+),score=21.36 TRINITY_DN1276_c1_g1_i3:323-1003(+)
MLQSQGGCGSVFVIGPKDKLAMKWTVCMASTLIGLCCLCVLSVRYWIPAHEYQACLAEGFQNGYIDVATFQQNRVPSKTVPCAAVNSAVQSNMVAQQQVGTLPLGNYAAMLEVNVESLRLRKFRNIVVSTPVGERYVAWCQSVALKPCDTYYLNFVYSCIICFVFAALSFYSILTQNAIQIIDDPQQNPALKFCKFRRGKVGKRKGAEFVKLEVIVEESEPAESMV